MHKNEKIKFSYAYIGLGAILKEKIKIRIIKIIKKYKKKYKN